MMQKCAHPNVIEVLGCFIEDENLYVIMRLASGGNLQRELNRRNRV